MNEKNQLSNYDDDKKPNYFILYWKSILYEPYKGQETKWIPINKFLKPLFYKLKTNR